VCIYSYIFVYTCTASTAPSCCGVPEARRMSSVRGWQIWRRSPSWETSRGVPLERTDLPRRMRLTWSQSRLPSVGVLRPAGWLHRTRLSAARPAPPAEKPRYTTMKDYPCLPNSWAVHSHNSDNHRLCVEPSGAAPCSTSTSTDAIR